MKIALLPLVAFLLLGNMVSGQSQAAKRLPVKVIEYNVVNKAKQIDHITLFDSDGLRTEEIEFFADGSVKNKTTFEYNALKQCVREVRYGLKGKVEKITTFEYNSDGLVVTESVQYPEKRYRTDKVYEYVYE